MCGIIGVAGSGGNAAEVIYKGLERLEYRGYDSAGISVLGGGRIVTHKRQGRVSTLFPYVSAFCGSTGIGHTRWATHGAPTDSNAHPHVCGAFAVVHNGIIENFPRLKKELSEEGAAFVSDTDTEVIAKLLDKYYTGDPLAAVRATVARLKGSFALAILCEDFDGVIAVRYKSPAIVGVADGAAYIASDATAFPQGVKKICPLRDGDIAVLKANGIELFDFDLAPTISAWEDFSPLTTETDLCGYPHYMIKEIREDGRTARETAEAFASVPVNTLRKYLSEADEVVFVGCGTAYNAGLFAKRFFGRTAGVRCEAVVASEARYFPPRISDKTLVVAVSQSGETADTVEAVRALKDKGAKVVAVTNCGYSAITRVADVVLPVCAHGEICVAATKSYIGQVVALYLFANVCGNLKGAEEKVCAVASLMPQIYNATEAGTLARECAESSAVFFLGRGADFDTAVEASLKLKEVSYVFSDAYPAGELKHGTLALVDEGTLCIIFITKRSLSEKYLSAAEQVRSRGGRAAVVSTTGDVEAFKNAGCSVWELPACEGELAPLLSSVAAQLIAYETAVYLRCDPDKPRNLAKSVTVE